MGRYLDPALLLLLEQSPAHGYTLLDRLPEFDLEFLAPTVVYRTLRQMEDKGWVISNWDQKRTQGPPRRVYSITPSGRKVLQCCIEQLQNSKQVLEYFLALYDELSPQKMSDSKQNLPADSKNKQEKNMRIVIPSEGNHLEAATSSVFGRSPEFIIVDPETLEFEVMDNPAVSASGGAGVQAAQTLLQKNINAVIAPNLGPNAFRVFQTAGLKAYYLQSGTVQQNIDAFKAGNLPPIDIPGPDHAGRGRSRHHGPNN
jgi:predicted Fe-Mo cluster-binding NifX family protein/DNA-binding HxlR family transcriptional regulator